MTVTNAASGTQRPRDRPRNPPHPAPRCRPTRPLPGGFTFNQFLVVDDEPLLFHTGSKKMFPLVREAVAHVLGDVGRLRWLSFSHFEADECGSLNLWLEAAPRSQAACSAIGAMVSVDDFATRPARALRDGEEIALGSKRVRWLDAPNLPHNWECGYLFEATTRTALLCGDLFTHAGAELPPVTETDVLGPAEAMRKALPASVAVDPSARAILEKLASTEPRALALMHGSSFRGDGGKLLRAMADALGV